MAVTNPGCVACLSMPYISLAETNRVQNRQWAAPHPQALSASHTQLNAFTPVIMI